MEVSGRFMPTEEPPVPTGQEARWGSTACLDAVDTEEYAPRRESKLDLSVLQRVPQFPD